MTPERWQQVREVLHKALQVAPDLRAGFLRAACSTDEALRKEVESLLASADQADPDFLAASALDVALAKGTRLGDFEVQSRIGFGGMGEVYRARDEKLNRAVAIKVLPPFFFFRSRAAAALRAGSESSGGAESPQHPRSDANGHSRGRPTRAFKTWCGA